MLESQAVRPAARRAYMYRRPRRMPRLTLLAAAIAVTASGWAGWRFLGDPEAGAPGQASPGGAGAAANPAGPARPQDALATAAGQGRPVGSHGSERGSAAPAARTVPNRPPPAAPRQDDAATRRAAAAPGSVPPAMRGPVPEPSAPAAPVEAAISREAESEAPQQLLLGRPSGPAPVPVGDSFDDAPRPPPGDPVKVRRDLTNAMMARGAAPGELERLRRILAELNERLVFGPEIVQGDPHAVTHIVQSGEQLGQIVKKERALVDWRFVRRINRITNERTVRVGQAIKLIRGPFHAEVSKRDYRLDIYLGDGPHRVYVRSFSVGLGELNSTPTGLFRIRPSSKMENPAWVNPRTREQYERDDPANPIGEHWLGLEGIEDHNRGLEGYGIHGTVEPESIGTDASMGCIRMLPQDVAIVYEMLVEGDSTVFIQP